jgi:hypothetical protein
MPLGATVPMYGDTTPFTDNAMTDPGEPVPVIVTIVSFVIRSVADAPISDVVASRRSRGVAGRSTGARDATHRTPPERVAVIALGDWSTSTNPFASLPFAAYTPIG